MPLAKPFKSGDNPGNWDTETGQTPNGIRHSEMGYCQNSSEHSNHKGEHPPENNESPGAYVASHSRLQSKHYLAGDYSVPLHQLWSRENH
jgi:hypothetical protein